MTPFDFVKIITYTKENISFEKNKQYYVPFIVNRALSYHLDCIFFSNEINMNFHLEPKLQYDFYYNVIRKVKRYSKWCKKSHIEEIKNISKKYKCNFSKAKEFYNILHKYE